MPAVTKGREKKYLRAFPSMGPCIKLSLETPLMSNHTFHALQMLLLVAIWDSITFVHSILLFVIEELIT